jgi:hypothetical protein
MEIIRRYKDEDKVKRTGKSGGRDETLRLWTRPVYVVDYAADFKNNTVGSNLVDNSGVDIRTNHHRKVIHYGHAVGTVFLIKNFRHQQGNTKR